jgi:FkbM family methyltransferase
MRAILRDLAMVQRLIGEYPLNRNLLDRSRAYGRFLDWQVRGRIGDGTLDARFVNGTRLRTKRRLGGRLHYVLGLAEFHDMAFVAHLLRPDEVFADVGANIGAYSLVAAACAGARCVAFEPTSLAYHYLFENVALNRLQERIELQQCAVGAEAGSIRLTAGMGEVNHVLEAGETGESIQVPMVSLDGFFFGRTPPALIKIDVEGFEGAVVDGAARLISARQPQALLMELAGHGARYGRDEAALRASLIERGYGLCAYDGLRRKLHRLDPMASHASYNLLFVRDFDAAQQRLREAAPFTLGHHRI